ncbi:major facilitator superfamily domain-containing protein [Melampsora americana]|nr:major facilitator superfamily domain-containing protein [Melampsora americana]
MEKIVVDEKEFDERRNINETEFQPRTPYSSNSITNPTITNHHETLKAERKLISKLDRIILPFTALLYLSAYLDRGNLGNAKLQGLKSQVLGNSDIKFSVVLCAFYITYIAFSIPGTLLSRAINPSTSMALGAMIWSVAASAMAGAQNYPKCDKALFGQTVSFYFTLWYKKNEVSKRIAIFIGAGTLAGAFGGLIAFGVSKINDPSISTWRILFLIEGLPSVLLAIALFFCLPTKPEKTRYLNEVERELLLKRLREDGLHESSTKIDWNGVKRAFTDWKTYVISVLYSCMNLTLGSVSGFLPTIVSSMGYSNASAQLHTVPPYAVALVFMISLSTISDKLSSRGFPIVSVFSISSIGWLILLLVETNQHVRYFATFCVVIGGYAAIPLIIGWVSNNTPNQSQRAVSLGMLNTVGQCLSIVASFIFPESEKPGWKTGFGTNLAFNLLAILISLSMTVYYRVENRKRDRKNLGEEKEIESDYDLSPSFRYVP